MMLTPQNTFTETIRLAVVEDDHTVRDGLQMLIEGSPGFSCLATYSNGEDALASLPELKPDVILMDINLPGINGIECILSLKTLNLPMNFIMLTVFEDADAIFNSLAAGASGYLLKQTHPAKLLEAIQDVHRGGSPMSNEIARKVVESFQQAVAPTDTVIGLTQREEELLSYLAKGYLYKEIADLMYISIDTVRSHIRHIYEKLQVNTRTEATLKYLQK
ncbi:MAG: response regulator transcription factor [Bacteroidota bacterium]|nr:response regulator transcription factor [Bacteroidota bacterium]